MMELDDSKDDQDEIARAQESVMNEIIALGYTSRSVCQQGGADGSRGMV